MADLELTQEQIDKLNRAMAGEEVELDEQEIALLNQVMSAQQEPPTAQPVAPARTASSGESALQGYAQGASFGMADELGGVVHQGVKMIGSGAVSAMKTGAGRALLRRLVPNLRELPDAAIDAVLDEGADVGAEQVLGVRPRSSGGPGIEGAGYSTGRDQMRADVRTAQESNPKTFFAGNVAGAMSVPMPGSGAAKPLQTVINRSLENAGKFGVQGALQGFGASEGDLLKGGIGEVAKDTALGGGVGAGMGFATGPAAYAWARHARPALQKLANSRAVAAIAPSAGLFNRLRNSGVRTEEELQQLGSDVLDSEIIKPFSSASGMKTRNDALMALEGANIGETMKGADELVSRGITPPPSRDLQREAVIKALRGNAKTPALKAEVGGVESKLLDRVGDDVPRPDNFPSSFDELWQNKSQLQSALKPDEFSDLGDRLYRKGVKGYTERVYEQVEGAVGPDELAKLRESAKKYGTAARIDDMLTDQATRKAVNQPISLGDAARGAAFSAIPGGSTAATLISALLRGRTDSTIATAAKALSKVRSPQVPDGAIRTIGTPDRLSKAYKAMLEKYGVEEQQAE